MAATSQLSLFYAKNTEWVHAFFVSQKKYLAAISQLSLFVYAKNTIDGILGKCFDYLTAKKPFSATFLKVTESI